jgi:GT2 family glycosyltransferase
MIYILLPVHNRKKTTEKFILSLVSQTYKDFRLILIDDGSKDGTAEMVLSYLPQTVLIQGDGNLWWAGSLQKGYEWLMRYADDTDICLIINDDTVFDRNFLSTGRELLSKKNKTLLLAQCYSQQNASLIDVGVHVAWKQFTFTQAKSIKEINCLSTRGLFLTISDFKIIGGFYPRILPHYFSDYEFTIRAYNKGYQLITNPDLKLYVDQETTGLHKIKSSNFKDFTAQYFSKRNPTNPIYKIVFLWLASPYPWKIYIIMRTLVETFLQLSKQFFKIKYKG